MKQVYQTNFTEHGDCLAACIASLLHLDLEDMPDFWVNPNLGMMTDSPVFWAQQWLAEHYSLSLVCINKNPVGGFIGTPVIAGIKSSLYPHRWHAVVAKLDRNGQEPVFMFDPNPKGSTALIRGITRLKPEKMYMFVPTMESLKSYAVFYNYK